MPRRENCVEIFWFGYIITLLSYLFGSHSSCSQVLMMFYHAVLLCWIAFSGATLIYDISQERDKRRQVLDARDHMDSSIDDSSSSSTSSITTLDGRFQLSDADSDYSSSNDDFHDIDDDNKKPFHCKRRPRHTEYRRPTYQVPPLWVPTHDSDSSLALNSLSKQSSSSLSATKYQGTPVHNYYIQEQNITDPLGRYQSSSNEHFIHSRRKVAVPVQSNRSPVVVFCNLEDTESSDDSDTDAPVLLESSSQFSQVLEFKYPPKTK